jgi:hypothetical protein
MRKNVKQHEILLCYDFENGIMDEEEDVMFHILACFMQCPLKHLASCYEEDV